MKHELDLIPIARIRSAFPEKFGIPRQAGLAPDLTSRVVFEPDYRREEALRGIEEYSYLWLIWGFSEQFDRRKEAGWDATVRPPRLGGKTRVGVFATRSPNRPNPIGLSSVRLLAVEQDPDEGTVLVVAGADLMDGTPIYDIKPYIPYTDSHPDAAGSFAMQHAGDCIQVRFPEELLEKIPEDLREGLIQVLAQDPRGAWEKRPGSVYGMKFHRYDIRFQVNEKELLVLDVTEGDAENVK